MKKLKKQRRLFGDIIGLALLLVAGMAPVVNAQQAASSNYSVNEVFMGTGGELNACSTAYCSKQTAGEMGVGNTASTSYQAQGGFNTSREPSLEFVVNTTNIDLGVLTPGVTATATATFSVKSYLSSGYIVQTVGNAPTNSSHQMTPLATPTASNTGAEQFGINLVANTNPVTFGANPAQSPSTEFGFGTAATDYNTTNLYKYVAGDTVAQSLKSSGQTGYTVSYIFNTTPLTPGGTYNMTHVLVATATF
jgi:hypothetical protein